MRERPSQADHLAGLWRGGGHFLCVMYKPYSDYNSNRSFKLSPYFGKGVMLMVFDRIVSLLGLLLATAGLAVDLVALTIKGKKRKRPDKRSRSKIL